MHVLSFRLIPSYGSRQSKVTQLDLAMPVNQYVRGLDIPVHHIRFVQEVECTKDVINYGNHMIFGELNCVRQVQYALQIVFFELHDDEHVLHVV